MADNAKTPPQFSDAADLILDGVENAFGIVPVLGRGKTKTAILSILEYYCLPNPERNQK